MMTPHTLSTIPQAASLGPQHRRDTMTDPKLRSPTTTRPDQLTAVTQRSGALIGFLCGSGRG
ncbi:hypothetical protein GDO81_024882 [Engystomops pustulosus]|uniref:Uncharacterized protein n=1 Tax=Engystomops pustulosus TaxID=76066 RepID=A0AAV6YJV0_ENGPU|nr:hypothetical protein GDO81_024882 [Engystomops pustulosus]